MASCIRSVTRARHSLVYTERDIYGPYTVGGLTKGDKKLWCACGLSKKQPWCDGSHKGTGIQPTQWTVPHSQSLYQLCACKYTGSPPYCDAAHTYLPTAVKERQERCTRACAHTPEVKLCTGCGWVPDF
ncbi:hypothetical protein ScPMuIL_011371 [Solemya velum]